MAGQRARQRTVDGGRRNALDGQILRHGAIFWIGRFVLGTAVKTHDAGESTHRVRLGGDRDWDLMWKDQSFHNLPRFEPIDA